MTIYEVSYTWYEDYSPRLLTAPAGLSFTKEEWQTYCNATLDQATDQAIAAEMDGDEPRLSWVGWDDIVTQVVWILEARGFQRVQPVRANYFGACILDRGDSEDMEMLSVASREKLIAHNGSVRRAMDEVRNAGRGS